jgi:RHS repeat-associated protein
LTKRPLYTATYDALQRFSQIRHSTAANVEIAHSYYNYDPAGRLTGLQTEAAIFTYGYDVLDQLTSEISSYPAPTPYSTATSYSYDANLRRIGVHSHSVLSTATYDAADQRLTLATTTTFSLPYSFTSADPLLGSQVNPLTTFSYDANGSPVTMMSGLYLTTYSWDGANRLKSVSLPDGGLYAQTYRFDDLRQSRQGPSNIDTFVYAVTDPATQRDGLVGLGSVLSTAPATGSAATGSAARWSSEAAPLLWWQRSGAASEWLVQTGGEAGLIRVVGQSATGGALNRQYHLDMLGSTAATSIGTGTTETTLTYDAWGNGLYPVNGPFPGTPVGTLTYIAAATGFGQALSLANAGYVALPPSVWTPTTAFSVSCRLQSTYSGSNPAILLGVSSVGVAQQVWIGLVNGAVNVVGSGLSTEMVGTTPVADGNWHTVLVTYNSGVWTLTVDGAPNATGSGMYVPQGSVHVAIGALPLAGSYRYTGLIDEVALFNTVISATVPTVPWANNTSGLVALYHLDGNLEDSAQSSTSDNRLGFVGGSGYWQEPELGLSYVRARWLNPNTGSWLSVDPVTSEPRYSYAHNMPTTRVDPSGRQVPIDSSGRLGGLGPDMPFYLIGDYLAQTPAVKTGIAVGVVHGFAAGWDAFVSVLVDSNEPTWYQMVESAAQKEQAGLQKMEAGIDASTIAAWKSFAALIPLDLPLAPPFYEPDFIRYGGGLMWGLVSAGLHFFLDTPADVVRLIQMIGWLFRPGKALNELGTCVNAFIRSLEQLVVFQGRIFG